MKNYTVTVNGNVYDVTVEEKSGAAPAMPSAPKAAPKAAPAPAAAAPQAAGSEGSVKVTSPFPGKVLSLKASVDDSVSKGAVIMIVEAMKMENEIVAPQDGTVASINVSTGDSIEAGDVLATLE